MLAKNFTLRSSESKCDFLAANFHPALAPVLGVPAAAGYFFLLRLLYTASIKLAADPKPVLVSYLTS